MRCAQCGMQNPDDHRFCKKCGGALAPPGRHASVGEQLLREAYVARIRGDLGMAIEKAQAALLADPNDASGHKLLGMLYASQNQPAKAVEHLERALQLQPTIGEVREELARMRKRLQREQRAQQFAQPEAAEAWPVEPAAPVAPERAEPPASPPRPAAVEPLVVAQPPAVPAAPTPQPGVRAPEPAVTYPAAAPMAPQPVQPPAPSPQPLQRQMTPAAPAPAPTPEAPPTTPVHPQYPAEPPSAPAQLTTASPVSRQELAAVAGAARTGMDWFMLWMRSAADFEKLWLAFKASLLSALGFAVSCGLAAAVVSSGKAASAGANIVVAILLVLAGLVFEFAVGCRAAGALCRMTYLEVERGIRVAPAEAYSFASRFLWPLTGWFLVVFFGAVALLAIERGVFALVGRIPYLGPVTTGTATIPLFVLNVVVLLLGVGVVSTLFAATTAVEESGLADMLRRCAAIVRRVPAHFVASELVVGYVATLVLGVGAGLVFLGLIATGIPLEAGIGGESSASAQSWGILLVIVSTVTLFWIVCCVPWTLVATGSTVQYLWLKQRMAQARALGIDRSSVFARRWAWVGAALIGVLSLVAYGQDSRSGSRGSTPAQAQITEQVMNWLQQHAKGSFPRGPWGAPAQGVDEQRSRAREPHGSPRRSFTFTPVRPAPRPPAAAPPSAAPPGGAAVNPNSERCLQLLAEGRQYLLAAGEAESQGNRALERAQIEAAIRAFQEAVNLDPSNRDAQQALDGARQLLAMLGT